mmetsp:Transcript_45952/g.131174  ORF Transcript_45952/g.131174 Transcript_45952/m.131174 type:complete len:486 (-) Transcript_45952:614-2071(-)
MVLLVAHGVAACHRRASQRFGRILGARPCEEGRLAGRVVCAQRLDVRQLVAQLASTVQRPHRNPVLRHAGARSCAQQREATRTPASPLLLRQARLKGRGPRVELLQGRSHTLRTACHAPQPHAIHEVLKRRRRKLTVELSSRRARDTADHGPIDVEHLGRLLADMQQRGLRFLGHEGEMRHQRLTHRAHQTGHGIPRGLKSESRGHTHQPAAQCGQPLVHLPQHLPHTLWRLCKVDGRQGRQRHRLQARLQEHPHGRIRARGHPDDDDGEAHAWHCLVQGATEFGKTLPWQRPPVVEAVAQEDEHVVRVARVALGLLALCDDVHCSRYAVGDVGLALRRKLGCTHRRGRSESLPESRRRLGEHGQRARPVRDRDELRETLAGLMGPAPHAATVVQDKMEARRRPLLERWMFGVQGQADHPSLLIQPVTPRADERKALTRQGRVAQGRSPLERQLRRPRCGRCGGKVLWVTWGPDRGMRVRSKQRR